MSQTFIDLKYHLIFATKYRMPWITEALEPELYAVIRSIVDRKRGRVLEIGGAADHVHILGELPQSLSVSRVVAAIKANSSKFAKVASGNPEFRWQSGYAAFTVSASQVARVRRYIQRQKHHHARIPFEEEMRRLRAHTRTD